MRSYMIHLLRHGITEGNLNSQLIGSTDMALSDIGMADLKRLKNEYVYPESDVIFSSPMKRCLQTAAILYPDKTPAIINNLKEMDFGEWEKKSITELENDPAYKEWVDSGCSTTPPKGEDSQSLIKRISEAFEGIVEAVVKTKTDSAVIISHGGVIVALMEKYAIPQRRFTEWTVENGCGYSLRIMPDIWMRDKKILAEGILPYPRNTEQENQDDRDEYPEFYEDIMNQYNPEEE